MIASEIFPIIFLDSTPVPGYITRVRVTNTTNAKGMTMNTATALEECRKELAMNFDRPAYEIVSYWASRIGKTYDEMRQMLRATCES